ncbi:MAG TPA: hypothetical protein VFQ41_20245 [Candidatus Angelobacter sp.]|nr:hypothetical protein [Candidatus Angelobacter sp.]
MFARKLLFAVLLSMAFVSSIGCGGGSPDCGVSGLNITPFSAAVNHVAAPPGNSQVFSASFQFKNNPGCPAVTAALVNSNWTASDPSVQLSAPQATQVTATCTAGVALPVTITATPVSGGTFTGQASLTCN